MSLNQTSKKENDLDVNDSLFDDRILLNKKSDMIYCEDLNKDIK